jgi:hypothetical protein
MGKLIKTDKRHDVAHLFFSAKTWRWTSFEVNQKFEKILKDLPKKTPRYIREYLRGCYDTHNDRLFRDELEHCYLTDQGLVSTRAASERYHGKIGFSVVALTGLPNGFYWRGTDKPWFNDEVQKAYDDSYRNMQSGEKTSP